MGSRMLIHQGVSHHQEAEFINLLIFDNMSLYDLQSGPCDEDRRKIKIIGIASYIYIFFSPCSLALESLFVNYD